MAFTINGTDVTPNLKSFKVDIKDLDSDSSNRNAAGVLVRDRIRVTRELECEWGVISCAQMSAILQAVSPTGVTAVYPDPQSGTDETKIFYAGDRSVPAFDFESNMWQGLTMNLIEM